MCTWPKIASYSIIVSLGRERNLNPLILPLELLVFERLG